MRGTVRLAGVEKMQSIDELAREIIDLTPSQQQVLLERVAQLNLQKGLRELAEKYRTRLARTGKLNIPPQQVWAELHRVRQEIATDDYPS
jgi:hypothetical protein